VCRDGRPEQIRLADASLRRLRTDRIDLFHQSDRARAPRPADALAASSAQTNALLVERGTSYASACGPWPESRCWRAALPMAASGVDALACRIDQSFAGPFARSSREIVTPPWRTREAGPDRVRGGCARRVPWIQALLAPNERDRGRLITTKS